MWFSVCYFGFRYPLVSLRSGGWLHLLPCLPGTSIIPSIFPSVTSFRRQFLRNMWPIQLTFVLFIVWVCRIFFPPAVYVILEFPRDRSSWSCPYSSSTTFQNFPGISDLLSEMSKFQYHTTLFSRCSTLLVSSINLSPVYWLKGCSCWKLLLPWQSWFSFHVYMLRRLLSCYPVRWNIPHSPAFFFSDLSYKLNRCWVLSVNYYFLCLRNREINILKYLCVKAFNFK